MAASRLSRIWPVWSTVVTSRSKSSTGFPFGLACLQQASTTATESPDSCPSMVMMVRDCSSVFVTRIIADLFPLHELARLYPIPQNINLRAINGVVMQTPDDAD